MKIYILEDEVHIMQHILHNGKSWKPQAWKKEYNTNPFVPLNMPVKLAQPDMALRFPKPQQTTVASQAGNDDPA